MTQSDINVSSQRRWLYGFNVAILVIIAIVILSFICYLTNRFNGHSDWTKGGLYSLSPSTKNLLRDAAGHQHDYEILSLFQPGTVHQRQVMDLLDEYARASSAIKIQDASDASLDEIQKRVRTLYAADFKPYQEAVDSFDPLADDLSKFFKLEGANIGATAQKPGTSEAALHMAEQLQGNFSTEVPGEIANLQRSIRKIAESTTPDYSKATDSLNSFADNLIRQFGVYINPKQFQDQMPKEIIAYFNDAIPRYKEMLAKLQAFKDKLSKLQPLKIQDLLDTLQTGRAEDNILVIGPTAAKIIPTSDIFKPPATQSPDATDQFNGEQAISSAILSLERPEKVKIVFITTAPQNLTSAGGPYSEIADTLRDSNFDVLEWSPPGPPANPNQPPPSPTPPAQGAGVVWVVFPPEAPNPQMMMMGMPPPNPQPVIDATHRHLAAGGQVLFLAEAVSGLMGASPDYAYAPLLKDYGIDVKSRYSAVTEMHQQNPNTGQLMEQAVPGVLLKRYSDDPITQPLQSLTTIFAPMQGQSGPVGIPTVVAKAATVPAGVDVHVLIEAPKSPDNWATTSLQPDSKFDATRDLASPIPLAVAAIRNKGQAGKESRIVVIGSNSFAANYWLDQASGYVMTSSGPQAIQAFPGNAELFRNAALWLAGYENMIAVSAKANAALRIGDISPTAMRIIGIVFFYVGLPLAALLAGGIVWFIRRK